MTAHGSPDRVPLEALLAHRDWVRALARRLVLDENVADDVEQETWRMAVERPPRHAESLRAWLRAVVTNAARIHGRKASRRLRHEAQADGRRRVPAPEELVAAAEMQTRLARAVLDLDEPYRSTVLYRFHEGLEASEIAARLGVPVETVRTRVKRGIERLRERMGVELGDDRDAWCLLVLGVRAERATPVVPVAAGTVGVAAALGGGLAMAAGTKLVVAAVVLVAIAAWRGVATSDAAKESGTVAAAPVAPSDTNVGVSSKRAPRTHTPVADEAAPTTEVAASAAHGFVAGVRVVDPDGHPVEGATVTVVVGPLDAKATSDADGVAVIERRAPDASGGVVGEFDVVKDGFARSRVTIRLTLDDGSPLPAAVLRRPAPIDGRIVDQDGRPVAGCYVDLIGGAQSMSSQTTGADGRFAFPDATAGEWSLRRFPPNPSDEWACGNQESAIRGGERDVSVVLHRLPVGRARLVATIVDGDTGLPLSADKAMLFPSVQGDEPIRDADAKTDIGVGTVTFPRMRPGRWRFWVLVNGRVPAVATVVVAADQTDVPVRVTVGRPGALRGRVDVGGTGLALPYMVIAQSADDWCVPPWVKIEADDLHNAARVQPDGTFRFPRVPPGRYRVWMDLEGWLGEGFADVPSGGEGESVVTFTRGGMVSFTLEAPSPSDRFAIEVSESGGPWRPTGGVASKVRQCATTLRPGSYRWRVKFPADNFVSARTAAETAEGEVTVVAGETAAVSVPAIAKR